LAGDTLSEGSWRKHSHSLRGGECSLKGGGFGGERGSRGGKLRGLDAVRGIWKSFKERRICV